MSTYWTTETLRAAVAQGGSRIIGPEGSLVHEPAPGVTITHTALRTAIWRLAKQHGWKLYFTQNSRKSPPGFPDLVLAREEEPVIYAELKIPPDTLSIEQAEWLRVLALASHTETYVWTPGDWHQIDARLTQPRKETL